MLIHWGCETMRTRCTHPKSLFLETPLPWDGASMMRIRSLSALKRGSILKKLGLVSNSVPANGSYRSEEPFYFFSALKAGFENLVQKQQLKPGSIVVLLVGLPWSADLSRQLLARLGKPEAVAAFLTVDLPQDQDSS